VQVFRFYPDGTVLDVLVRPAPAPGDARALAHWLRRESPRPGVHPARYTLRGSRLAFTTRGHLRDEEITVHGTWAAGRLTLSATGPGWGTGPRPFTRLHG
jgi:hypothetical protein